MSVGSPTGDLGADDELGGLVLGAHQRERLLLAPVPHPGLVDPVRVRLGKRPRWKRRDERREALGEPARDGIREARRVRKPRVADELDDLVDDGVRRSLAPGDLVAGDPERSQHGRVELARRPAAEHVDPVVDRADALNRAVGDALGERPVARVEPGGGRRHRPVRVRPVLEDPAHDLVGRTCGRARSRANPAQELVVGSSGACLPAAPRPERARRRRGGPSRR